VHYIGGRKITPRHAIEILESIGPVVAGATRLHDETECVPNINVTSHAHRQSGKNATKGAGAGEYACYQTDYHNTKYFQGCTTTSSDTDDTDSSSSTSSSLSTPTNSGACYDMTVHQCSCDPGSCTAELCQAQDGIWTAECPTHCRASDCQQSSEGGVVDDTLATNSSSSSSNGTTISKSNEALDATTTTTTSSSSSGPQDNNDPVVGSLAESSSSAATAATVVAWKKLQQRTMLVVVVVVAVVANLL